MGCPNGVDNQRRYIMNDEIPKGPDITINDEQLAATDPVTGMIKLTNEQIEAYRKFADEIGIPDTLDGLDD